MVTFIFSCQDTSIKSHIPDYGKTRKASVQQRSNSAMDGLLVQSISSTSLESAPSNNSTRRKSSNNQINLNEPKIEYLLRRWNENLAKLQSLVGSWYAINEMVGNIEWMADELIQISDMRNGIDTFNRIPNKQSALCLTRNTIVKQLYEVMINLIQNGHHLPIRKSATEQLIYLLHLTHLKNDRATIVSRIHRDIAKSNSYRNRMLYLYLAKSVSIRFSSEFFKRHGFFDECLSLSGDKIPNVRLALCRILPHLKASLRLPKDRLKLQQLESIIRKFYSHDSDRDVMKETEIVIKDLDQTNVAVESLSRAAPEDEERDVKDQEKLSHEQAVLNLQAVGEAALIHLGSPEERITLSSERASLAVTNSGTSIKRPSSTDPNFRYDGRFKKVGHMVETVNKISKRPSPKSSKKSLPGTASLAPPSNVVRKLSNTSTGIAPVKKKTAVKTKQPSKPFDPYSTWSSSSSDEEVSSPKSKKKSNTKRK